MSTPSLIAVALIALVRQDAVELESPAQQAGSRVAAPQETSLEQRDLYIYDVADIVAEAAKRTSFRFGKEEGAPVELDEKQAKEAALEELVAYVRDFIQPSLDSDLDDIKVAGATLVANVRPVHDAWLRGFLEKQRVPDCLIDIQARIFDGADGTFDAFFDRPSKVLADRSELTAFIEELRAAEGVQDVQSPRLMVFPRQRAHISILNEIAYIKEYQLEIIQPGDVLIADPVIDVLQDGFVIEMRAAETADDECGLDIEIRYSKTKQPIATKKVKVSGVSEPVTVGSPEVTSISVRSKAVLASGAAIAFRAPDPTGERDFVVLARVTVVRGERLTDMVDAPVEPVERREPLERQRR